MCIFSPFRRIFIEVLVLNYLNIQMQLKRIKIVHKYGVERNMYVLLAEMLQMDITLQNGIVLILKDDAQRVIIRSGLPLCKCWYFY
jgi:hypothetical protein